MKYSPSFLVFLRNIATDGSFYGLISEDANNAVTVENKVLDSDMVQQLPDFYENIRKRLEHSYEINARIYNSEDEIYG